MTEASPPTRTGIPPGTWVHWALAAVGFVLMATPYRAYAYWPLLVAFFAMFISFIGGVGDKGLLRYREIATGQLIVTMVGMTVAIALAPWSNAWHVATVATAIFAVNLRYAFFGFFGYTKLWGVDVLLMVAVAVAYVVGNLATPPGIVGWITLAPLVLFMLVGFRMVTVRQLQMKSAIGRAVGVSDLAPDFTLETHRGETVTLSDYRGKRLVMLFFVRGDWCPACHIMLRAYQRNRQKFMDHNTVVLGIGPDPTGVNREMVDTLGLEYGLLHDEGLKVAKAYGVLLEGPQPGIRYPEGMPTPTSFLIDKEGIIRFSSKPDQSGILNPEAIFPVMDSLAA